MNASWIQKIPDIGQNVAASIGHLVGQNDVFIAAKGRRVCNFNRCRVEIKLIGFSLLNVKGFKQ